MPVYNNRQVTRVLNKQDVEEFLESRNLDQVVFRNNFIFNYVETEQYAFIEHVWSHGDRLFKIARQYLGDFRLYWVIGLFNKKPTDTHYKFGDIVYIPIDAEEYYRQVVQ